MVSVGLCYKGGVGTKKSFPDAVNYLRSAAQRGSQFAYEELLRIYDDIRPDDIEFNTANRKYNKIEILNLNLNLILFSLTIDYIFFSEKKIKIPFLILKLYFFCLNKQ